MEVVANPFFIRMAVSAESFYSLKEERSDSFLTTSLVFNRINQVPSFTMGLNPKEIQIIGKLSEESFLLFLAIKAKLMTLTPILKDPRYLEDVLLNLKGNNRGINTVIDSIAEAGGLTHRERGYYHRQLLSLIKSIKHIAAFKAEAFDVCRQKEMELNDFKKRLAKLEEDNKWLREQAQKMRASSVSSAGSHGRETKNSSHQSNHSARSHSNSRSSSVKTESRVNSTSQKRKRDSCDEKVEHNSSKRKKRVVTRTSPVELRSRAMQGKSLLRSNKIKVGELPRPLKKAINLEARMETIIALRRRREEVEQQLEKDKRDLEELEAKSRTSISPITSEKQISPSDTSKITVNVPLESNIPESPERSVVPNFLNGNHLKVTIKQPTVSRQVPVLLQKKKPAIKVKGITRTIVDEKEKLQEKLKTLSEKFQPSKKNAGIVIPSILHGANALTQSQLQKNGHDLTILEKIKQKRLQEEDTIGEDRKKYHEENVKLQKTLIGNLIGDVKEDAFDDVYTDNYGGKDGEKLIAMVSQLEGIDKAQEYDRHLLDLDTETIEDVDFDIYNDNDSLNGEPADQSSDLESCFLGLSDTEKDPKRGFLHEHREIQDDVLSLHPNETI